MGRYHSGLVRIFESASLWTALEPPESTVRPINRLTRPILDEPNGSKDFFFFFFLFPSLKKGVILTLKLIPSQTFAASHHCHLFRLQSYDIIGPTMMSSPSRWCHHHPTMTPLSLSFDSSPAMSSTPRRCCYHPNMPLPSDDDTIPTATITYNVESCQFVINNNLINKL